MAPTPNKSGAGAEGNSPGAGLMSLMPLVLIFILFYVLFILPQRKQQKKHKEALSLLKKGDEVVTSGGMFGTIAGFNERENTVYLKMAENVKIEIQRSSISGLRQANTPEQKK
ncbi:preprotein translocase subunit YajC [bacterium]|nr:preprotein translocase subunit YajC [bacterium]